VRAKRELNLAAHHKVTSQASERVCFFGDVVHLNITSVAIAFCDFEFGLT